MVEQINEEFNRAMVVVAHADDAEWGCAGTVARLCAEGWDVAYVICTDGSKGSDDPDMTVEMMVKMREDEQRDAASVLGLSNVFFLGYPDAYLESTLELRKDISRAIRIHRPDVLICMNPVRNLDGNGYIDHPDHFASGDAAMGAVYPAARDRLTFPELLNDEGLEPHKVREVWVMGRTEPDHVVTLPITSKRRWRPCAPTAARWLPTRQTGTLKNGAGATANASASSTPKSSKGSGWADQPVHSLTAGALAHPP